MTHVELNNRTFRGATTRAAFAAVRDALGDDAIVVETREERGQAVVVARAPVARFELAPPLTAPRAVSAASVSAAPQLHAPTPAPRPRPAPRTSQTQHPLLERLLDRGVADHIAQRALDRAARMPQPIDAALRETLHDLVESAPAPWRAAPRQRVVALVGPTGVGKTTTIAKMAARALIDHKQTVALVTLDTWRIGAVEHMRRFGEILEVPMFVAQDAASLRAALARVANRDIVFIDTAGRSPHETQSFTDQLTTLTSLPDVEIHLTVAAATPVRQLRAVRERYAAHASLRAIVTKLDESDGAGALVNAGAILGRPLAAFTDGQRVPEDLHGFDVGALAHEVLA
jgi:flagellar biosynthesis protein FlhF